MALFFVDQSLDFGALKSLALLLDIYSCLCLDLVRGRNAGGDGCRHFFYDALRRILGVEGSKCGASRNANEKIEDALIDIAIPKNEWGYRCLDVPQCLNKSLTNLRANESN